MISRSSTSATAPRVLYRPVNLLVLNSNTWTYITVCTLFQSINLSIHPSIYLYFYLSLSLSLSLFSLLLFLFYLSLSAFINIFFLSFFLFFKFVFPSIYLSMYLSKFPTSFLLWSHDFYLLFTPLEFFKSVLADGFSLEFEWQQVSSSLQDSSQYSGRPQQCCRLDSLYPSAKFQVLQAL